VGHGIQRIPHHVEHDLAQFIALTTDHRSGAIISPHGDARCLDPIPAQDNGFIQKICDRTERRLTAETINA
jgi:hypothetical protein